MKKFSINIVFSVVISLQIFASEEFLDKKETLLKDGRSFQQFEDEFRQKYSSLNIPEAIKVSLKKEHGACYYRDTKEITISHNVFKNESVGSLEWTMLHEIGHHNEPYLVRNGWKIFYDKGYSLLGCYALYELTKDTVVSKLNDGGLYIRWRPFTTLNQLIKRSAIAIPCIYAFDILVDHFKMRPCEHYADNFANKHGSQEALQEGFKVFQRYNINEFDDFKKAWDEYIEKNKDEVIKKCSLQEAKEKGVKIYNLPFLISLVKLIGDPDHPSFISRANKIAKALKNRFGVEISQERDK